VFFVSFVVFPLAFFLCETLPCPSATASNPTVGFARSLLAYELPDGRLKLLDGHLRRDLDPDLEVDVEILDVTDDEARVLLLS
jgi:hypothetical protein